MIKVTTISATVLTTLTLFGMAQPIVSHADQVNSTPTHQTTNKANTQSKEDTTGVVNIPDAPLKASIKKSLGVKDDNELTESLCQAFTGTIDCSNVGAIKDFSGLEHFKNATQVGFYTDSLKDCSNMDKLEAMPKLAWISLMATGLTQDQLDKFDFSKWPNLTAFHGENDHIYDLSKIQNFDSKKASGSSFADQTLEEAPQSINAGEKLVVNVKPIKNLDGTTPTITPSDGGVYDSNKGTITWSGLDASKTSVNYKWTGNALSFGGTVTVPVTVAPVTSSNDVNVSYTATVKPSDPQWYGVVPTAIALSDEAKTVDATVKLTQDTHGTTYSGSKSVGVTVKSDNAYQLKDGKNTVEYKLDKAGKDKDFFNPTTDAQDLGTLSEATPEIDSKAHLTGTATASGKYTDILHYVFTEK